jgi:hypothetical protein
MLNSVDCMRLMFGHQCLAPAVRAYSAIKCLLRGLASLAAWQLSWLLLTKAQTLPALPILSRGGWTVGSALAFKMYVDPTVHALVLDCMHVNQYFKRM